MREQRCHLAEPNCRRRWCKRLALALLVSVLVSACGWGWGQRTSAVVSDKPTGVVVSRVVDGDTIEITAEGQTEVVRLIGINSSEQGECLADDAARLLEELLAGHEVTLVSDSSDTDRYGRLLRYVYVDELFINRVMVEQGLALSRRYEPDTAQSDELDLAQSEAVESGRGMWNREACGPSTGQVVEIGEIVYDAEGDDRKNLNGEWVDIRNPSDQVIELDQWAIRDESASHRFGFPDGFSLEPGETVSIHSGCGTNTASHLFWCSGSGAIWNNTGDTVFVHDAAGNIVVFERYVGQ